LVWSLSIILIISAEYHIIVFNQFLHLVQNCDVVFGVLWLALFLVTFGHLCSRFGVTVIGAQNMIAAAVGAIQV